MSGELDFVWEGRQTDLFRSQHTQDKGLVIPQVYWAYTRKRVLALELMEGIKISEIDRLKSSGADTRLIAGQLVQIILKQIFVYGKFHADPHPGNILVLPDQRIALIDFGMSGHFDRHTRMTLADLLRDIVSRDHLRMADHLLQHGLIGYDTDLRDLSQELRALFRQLEGGGQTAEIAEAMMQFVVRHKFSFPPDLFFLDKVFGTLDGAVRTLDPTLQVRDLASAFMPELAKGVLADWPQYARQLLVRLMEMDDTLLSLPSDLSRLLKRLDAGYLQMTPVYQFSPEGNRQISRLLLKFSGFLSAWFCFGMWIWLKTNQAVFIPELDLALPITGGLLFLGSVIALLRA